MPLHYLDDKVFMDNLLHEDLIQYVCLTKLAFLGGMGPLPPERLATALRTSKPFIDHAIKKLVEAKRITPVGKSGFVINEWSTCSLAKVRGETVLGPIASSPIRLSPLRQEKTPPSEEALALVREYHRAFKPGGPYIEAADQVDILITSGGWTKTKLSAAILGYARSLPQYPRNAFNFFQVTEDNRHFFGEQFIELGQQTNRAPKNDADISELAQLFVKNTDKGQGI